MQLSIANEFWKRCWSVWVSVVFCGRAFILVYKPVPERSKSDDRPWHGLAKCLNHSMHYLVHDCFSCTKCSPIVHVAAYLRNSHHSKSVGRFASMFTLWSCGLWHRAGLVGGGKGSVFLRSVVAHLHDCNTVSRRPRRGFVSIRPWKPLVMRLSLYWNTMACRRGGKDVPIYNLRGWRPQIPVALHLEWAVINCGVRSVGVGAALNILTKQRIEFPSVSPPTWPLTGSTVLAYYRTTNCVLSSDCFWARACVI
jgi:hypothetical protein